MTVQAGDTFKRYAANGVATVYAIPFLLLDAADLVVTLDDVVVSSGFTLTGVGNPSSTATFSVAPSGDLLFRLVVPFQRLFDYQENGDFLAETVNADFDRIWLALKELRRFDDRALKVSDLEPEGIPDLPSVEDRIGKLLSFDAFGNPIAIAADSQSATELALDLANPEEGAGLVGIDTEESYPANTVGSVVSGLANATKIAKLTTGLSDYSAEINAFAATLTGGKTGSILPGVYPCESKLYFPKDAKLLADGVVLDFSAAADIGDFPGSVCVEFGGGSLAELANPSVAPSVGGYTLTFAAPPDVASDDVLFIWNDVAASWSGFRNEYRAGEAVVVRALSGSDVLLNSPLLESYTTAVRVFKLTPTRPKCVGLEVKLPTALAVTGVYTTLSRNAEFHKVKALMTGVAGITIDRSIGFAATSCETTSDRSVLVGDNYGLSVSNSQWGLVMGGRYEARRHGVTMGGTSLDASIPTRFVKVQAATISSWDIQCADMHGNVEFCSYDDCTMLNGVTISGNNNAVRGGTIVAPALAATGNGVAISINEAKGTNFEFSNLTIRALGDPSTTSRGVIDFGGNSTAMNANTVLGGTLLFSDITLSAPNARVPFDIVNNGSLSANKELVIRNMRWSNPPATRISSGILDTVSGTQFARADLDLKFRDVGAPAGMTIEADKISGLSESGITASVSVAASVQDVVITFNNRFPKAPSGRCSINAHNLGVVVASTVLATTVSNMTVRIYSTGGAAMTSGSAFNINWSAVLDE